MASLCARWADARLFASGLSAQGASARQTLLNAVHFPTVGTTPVSFCSLYSLTPSPLPCVHSLSAASPCSPSRKLCKDSTRRSRTTMPVHRIP